VLNGKLPTYNFVPMLILILWGLRPDCETDKNADIHPEEGRKTARKESFCCPCRSKRTGIRSSERMDLSCHALRSFMVLGCCKKCTLEADPPRMAKGTGDCLLSDDEPRARCCS
jgi:hypothetical protein